MVDHLESSARVCSICGKGMIILNPADYVYKRTLPQGNTHWFCSYPCFRVDQKKHEAKKKQKRR